LGGHKKIISIINGSSINSDYFKKSIDGSTDMSLNVGKNQVLEE